MSAETIADVHDSPAVIAEKAGGFRQAVYWATAVGLLALFVALRGSSWQGSAQLHTLMEVAATILAFLVGLMALFRYYSKKNNTILIIGAGFIGTALLDGYHAVVTSAAFAPFLPSDLPALIPWSWVASRFFLSLLLFLSWSVWYWEAKKGRVGVIEERHVYTLVAVMTLISFVFFAFAPLPRAYYPEFVFGRPEEFVPAALFLAALIGYLYKGAWRSGDWEHWLVLALIVSVISQAVFMSSSFGLFDFEFDAAHTLKKVSYVLVLIGLLVSMYLTFKRAESATEDLARSNAELKKSNEELEQFAYVASHDLKAPLRGIDNLSNFIRDDVGDGLSDETEKNFNMLQGRIRRMEKLLDSLLEYSRAGRKGQSRQTLNVDELLHDIITLIAPPDAFQFEVIGAGCRIRAARAPLQQVLMNIIGNAVKHHDHPTGKVTVQVRNTQNAVVFTVSDDGPGIPRRFHERVFQMFQTLRPRDELEGSGMGLAVVKKVVESVGGSISVHSEDGVRGTKFAIVWPKHEDDPRP